MCTMLRRLGYAIFDKGIHMDSNCKNLHFNCINQLLINIKEENIYYNTVQAINNNSSWYTVAYVHPESGIIFYIDGDDSVSIESQALFWYPSREEALNSVKMASHANIVDKENNL